MAPRVRRGVVVGVVLACLAAAGAVLLFGEDGVETLPELDARGVTANTLLEPREHLFGDVVSARVEVLLDRGRVDPAAVRLRSSFEPYEPAAPQRTERLDAGELTRLRFTFRLRCLVEACLALTAANGFAFPAGAVLEGGERVAAFEWPEIALRWRVAQPGTEPGSAGAWRVNITEVPAATFRIAPGVLVGLLAALAGVLVAAGVVLLVAALRRTPSAPRRLPPLERALLLLDAARRRAEFEEERKALDLLAVELSRHGESDLARAASELAWARLRPASEATDRLTERVGELVAGRNGRRA